MRHRRVSLDSPDFYAPFYQPVRLLSFASQPAKREQTAAFVWSFSPWLMLMELVDRCDLWSSFGVLLGERTVGPWAPVSTASRALRAIRLQKPAEFANNSTTNTRHSFTTMTKLSKRISALFHRKANLSTTEAPAAAETATAKVCLLYTSPSPRDS